MKMKIKFNEKGLLPAIVQSAEDNTVLMLAYMNKTALKKTLKEKRSWFWSRKRKQLWLKGETSGNIQIVKEIRIDCDNDAILLKVQPKGPACHTGHNSCFYRKLK